jgi:putative flippase GtrA
MILTNQKERSRFFRFAVVGCIGAVIDFGVFNILSSVVRVPAVIASIISFLLAVCSNFIWNRYWTYPDSRSKAFQHQMMQFVIISLAGLAIRTPLFAFLEKLIISEVSLFQIPSPLTPVMVGHNIALAIVILIVMFWNFFANRFWTYADVK